MRRPSPRTILRGLVVAGLVAAWVLLPAAAVLGHDGRSDRTGQAAERDGHHDGGQHDNGGDHARPAGWTRDDRRAEGAGDSGGGDRGSHPDQGSADAWRWWRVPRGGQPAPVDGSAGAAGAQPGTGQPGARPAGGRWADIRPVGPARAAGGTGSGAGSSGGTTGAQPAPHAADATTVLPAVRPAVGATEPAPPGSVDGPTPRPSAGPPLTPDGSAVLSVATPADPSGPSLALAVAPVVAAAIVLTLIAAGFSVRASLAKVD